MKNQNDGMMHIAIEVSDDGSLTLSDAVVRSLGYQPGDVAEVSIPLDLCLCPCEKNGLLLSRGCPDREEPYYATDYDQFNIPNEMLADANIPTGRDVTVMVADGALLLVATGDALEDLPVEVIALLNELGISPLTIHRIAEDVCGE